MRRLVESWVAAERDRGYNLAALLRCLNETLGTRTRHSRLAEWRRGAYTPSPEAVSVLVFWTLPWALARAGIAVTNEQQQALDALLWDTDELRKLGAIESPPT